MADERIQFNEQMIGANHPTLADTLNRLALVEHNGDGTHKKLSNVTDPWVDVRAHGAVGDGAADDTAAIQGAITSLFGVGGIVLLPAGTFKTTSSLTVPAGVSIVGVSQKRSVIDCFASGNAITVSGTEGAPLNFMTLASFTVKGQGAYSADQHGVYIENMNGNLLLDRMDIYNHGDAGVYSRGYNFYAKIQNSNIYSNKGSYNVHVLRATTGSLYRTNTFTVDKCVIFSAQGGVTADDCTNLVITNSGFESIDGTNPEINVNKGVGTVIRDNYIERSNSGTAPCINITGDDTGNRSNGTAIQGNIISTSSNITHNQINADFADYTYIKDNTQVRNYSNVTPINLTGNARYVTIDGKTAPGSVVQSSAVGVTCVDRGVWDLRPDSTTATAIRTRFSGDADNRFFVRNTGEMRWGNGTDAPDVTLYRYGADVLATDDVFRADNIKGGTGSPEGVVIGKVGDMYLRSDGGAFSTLYVKESGTGNTGWVGK